MKEFIRGFILINSLFYLSCNNTLKGDIDYFKKQGWLIDSSFSIDPRGSFKMGDFKNIMLENNNNDTVIFFEYLKRESSLKALRYEKLFSSVKAGSKQKLYHRLGFDKKDTLFYYTSSIPKNVTNIDSMTFVIGREYYLEQMDKN